MCCCCCFVNIKMAMLSCPLCCQSNFPNLMLLHSTLISVLNGSLICPICSDVQHGLDAYTIHLTKHINIPSQIDYSELQYMHDVNNVTQNQNNICNSRDLNHVEQMPSMCNGNVRSIENLTRTVTPLSIDKQHTFVKNTLSNTLNPADNESAEPFICHLCACSFHSAELQLMHMQLFHVLNECQNDKLNETNNNNNSMQSTSSTSSTAITVNSSPNLTPDPNAIQCYVCSKNFKMIGSLRLHLRMIHGISQAPHEIQSQSTPSATATNANGTAAAGRFHEIFRMETRNSQNVNILFYFS